LETFGLPRAEKPLMLKRAIRRPAAASAVGAGNLQIFEAIVAADVDVLGAEAEPGKAARWRRWSTRGETVYVPPMAALWIRPGARPGCPPFKASPPAAPSDGGSKIRLGEKL
jgi:hypothetical protein